MYLHMCRCAQAHALWGTPDRKDQEFELPPAAIPTGTALQDAVGEADKSQKVKTETKFVKHVKEIGKFQKEAKSFRC